ncbi:MAG: hypothetical protein WB699_00535, partial [Bacteroidota bacterium]
LTVVALGDAGERGSILRGNASVLEAMRTGDNDGGDPSVLVFLGDDFGPTGLNVPVSAVSGEVQATLGFFRPLMEKLGQDNIHGIPGETEYYSQKAVETTALFGLIKLSEWPVGLSDRGVQRATEQRLWRYHAHFPASAVYPANDGSRDSVQMIFLDTGLLLRTRPQTWTAALDSLRSILAVAKSRPGVAWHVLYTHHPLVSYGEHGGYTEWNDEDSTVDYMPGCDKDSNAYRYVRNWLDPEDLCADRYVSYRDSLESIIAASGVTVQIQISSHDQSLQLIDRNSASGVPHVQIISGCGSKSGMAKIAPYTAARKANGGNSLTGFVQVRWQAGSAVVTFFNEHNGDRIDMGGGATAFRVDQSGHLTPLIESH